jgi:hypothetical protein
VPCKYLETDTDQLVVVPVGFKLGGEHIPFSKLLNEWKN